VVHGGSVWVSQACPLFLIFPGTSSTSLSPLSSARSRDRAPSSNRFRIATYLDPRVGPQGTWGRDNFAIATRWFHLRSTLARARLATFWSFRLYTTMAFPKMRAIILAWFWCWRPPIAIEGLPSLDFSTTKPCTSFKCLVNNHFAQYATLQLPTLHFHLDLTFVHSLSFRAKLGGQRSASGWEACLVSSFGPKLEKWKFKKQNEGIAKHQITKSHTTPISMNYSKILQ
jgi:hypothetical protein